MKRAADWFENDATHGGIVRTDYSIIAVAALFEEHCRKKAKPFAYKEARGIAEDRRNWFFNEMLECIFSALCAGVSFWLCGWFTGFRMLGTTYSFLVV